MDELWSPKPLCKRQRLACSPVQTKPDASSLRSMLRRQASRLRPDAWLLTLCSVQRHHSQTLWVDILSIKDCISGKTVLIEKKEDLISVILQVIQQSGAPLQTLLNHCWTQQEFPGTSQISSTHLSCHAGHSGDWNFLLLWQSCPFLAWVVFEVFYIYCWLITRGLSDRRRTFRHSEVFKRCTTW